VITWVYGGVSGDGWTRYFLDPFMQGLYNLRLYAAKGYAVLLPSIPLERDGKEDPLMALTPSVDPAVDKLVAMGIADPARVGVMGQSFGGYTALGLATQSKRFRAVVAIALISDLTADYGAFDPTARDYAGIDHEKSDNALIAELTAPAAQVPLYADPDRYQRNSPLTFVGDVTAPVLLIHGERDIRGTSYQAEAFFTGLWRQGKTARIVRYWGEDHAMAASPATVRSVVGEILRWFDTYLAPAPAGQ
jgi:dipeptidyl aminopeptidase/acylaminoacyl peptidase